METYAYAVDLGATNVRAALISKEGKIAHKIQKETPRKGRNNRVISDAVIEMLSTLQAAYPHVRSAGIGISSLGPLDYVRCGPIKPPNLPFAFVPLVEPVRKKFSIPVFLLNDCNAAVLGEQRFGAGKKKKNLVYITVSTGVGGGAIVNDTLLLGRSGNAGEIGHLVVDSRYNLPCTCGRGMGHWEGYASGRSLPQFFSVWCKKWKVKNTDTFTDTKKIFNRAHRGDHVVLRFLDELNTINARAISNVIVAYDPEVITIGGSVMLSNESLLLAGMKKKIDRYLKKPVIKVTPLAHDAGLLGAAAAVFNH